MCTSYGITNLYLMYISVRRAEYCLAKIRIRFLSKDAAYFQVMGLHICILSLSYVTGLSSKYQQA
jgi:hypothetical protein